MIDPIAATHIAAMIVGILMGIAMALPWRPLIRRKIQTRNIAELSRALHEAIAELERQDNAMRSMPFSGTLHEATG